jgi:hypothetical protein
VHNGNAALHDAKKRGNNQYYVLQQGLQKHGSGSSNLKRVQGRNKTTNEIIPFFQGKI